MHAFGLLRDNHDNKAKEPVAPVEGTAARTLLVAFGVILVAVLLIMTDIAAFASRIIGRKLRVALTTATKRDLHTVLVNGWFVLGAAIAGQEYLPG